MPSIQELRTARGWSQEELARRAIVSFRTVNRLERGEIVSVLTLRRVCAALGVDPDEVTQVKPDTG